jgi:hypothetical protein
MATELAQQDSFFRLQRLAENTTNEREQIQDLFLVSNSDSIDFLNLVEGLAPQEGVQLSTEQVEEIQTAEGQPDWVKIDFTFSGSREAVENFVQIIETLPYVLRVDYLSMNLTSGSEWRAEVTVKVQLLNYD